MVVALIYLVLNGVRVTMCQMGNQIISNVQAVQSYEG
jgi:hypothetical protein